MHITEISEPKLSREEAAAYLNISLSTLIRIEASGKLKAQKIRPKKVLYAIDDLKKYNASLGK